MNVSLNHTYGRNAASFCSLAALAEAIVCQAVEDLWSRGHRRESIEFFTGRWFVSMTKVAGISPYDRLRLMGMVKEATVNNRAEGRMEIKGNTWREQEEIPPSPRASVLVMDHDEAIGAFAGSLLRRFGYDAYTAKCSEEAVYLYERAIQMGLPFSAVILDMHVQEGMGGMEVAKRLLKIDPLAKTIASINGTDGPAAASLKKNGFCGVLTKPYRIKKLKDMLHKAIYSGTT